MISFDEKGSQPKSFWAENANNNKAVHHNMADDNEEEGNQVTKMEVDTATTNRPPTQVEVDTERTQDCENKKKRGPPLEQHNTEEKAEDPQAQLMAMFKEQAERAQRQIEQKDIQIAGLMSQIELLTKEVKALREDIKAQRTTAESNENI